MEYGRRTRAKQKTCSFPPEHQEELGIEALIPQRE